MQATDDRDFTITAMMKATDNIMTQMTNMTE